MPSRKSAGTVKAGKRASLKKAPVERKPPATPAHDLLADPLLGVALQGGAREWLDLPGVLEALGKDEIEGFSALQAHQQHAWHAFLVQLAAIALHRAEERSPRLKAARWRELLAALTKGRHEPWTLVVPDLPRPAFLQPPVLDGTLDGFKARLARSDELDLLVTSKNHDVKAARAANARPEHWVYALVSLQTMQGFSGRSNYGIARMNGGAGSRPGLGLAPGHALGARFRRDTAAALEARDAIRGPRGYKARGGIALLWLEPWDGKSALTPGDLDPLFIEICRRVRLDLVDGMIGAHTVGSANARIDAGDLRGNTGDPWTPVQKAESKPYTATEAGFSYRVLHRLLGDDYQPGVAQVPRRGDSEVEIVATVLARGMGKTAGFHERRVPVPGDLLPWLADAGRRALLGAFAGQRVQLAADVQRHVLKPAVLAYLQGAPDELNFKDRRAGAWLEAHDAEVDRIFFERLWADLSRDAERALAEWARTVLDLARAQLQSAFEDAPVPIARRYRAIAAAERVFEGAARKHVKLAFDPEKEQRHEA
ncbi:CRISPR-associated protein, Cse1 family [Anaeromyxobacter dehalogenans 2CP-1]|uniref:CRISPR-associated protein, Cse1 family n=2 Tax=Anaeromyxobacter dehalogenans TaxID=161493 RepID=B8JDN8_ANAD2|nr:CRISPR-associated protein, Cse1 family [Anaeromyxobacter dehalogenans 2CP-1]